MPAGTNPDTDDMNRRRVLQGIAAALLCPPAAAAADDLLAAGGCALLLRHARTEAGIGDPPGYRLDDCATQRRLSADGREQARRAGAWLRSRGLTFDGIFSSRWCRCTDTAALMFPGQKVEVMDALNSFFDVHEEREARTAHVRALVGALDGARRIALVTHMVNIMALTGEHLAMGEAVIVGPDRRGGLRIAGRVPLS